MSINISVQVETSNEPISGPSQIVAPEKQDMVKTSVPPTEVPKLVPDDVMYTEIAKLEQDNLHNFYNCKNKSCTEFSEEDEIRQKLLKKRRMHHSWLEEKDLAYCKTTGIWWLLFSEKPGVFCFLCRKHKTLNIQDSAAVFSSTPRTRCTGKRHYESMWQQQCTKLLLKQR